DRLAIPLNETACAEGIAPSRAGGPTPDLCPGVTPRDKYQCRRDDGLRYAHPQEGAPLQIDGPNLRAVLGTRSQNQIRRSQTTFAGGGYLSQAEGARSSREPDRAARWGRQACAGSWGPGHGDTSNDSCNAASSRRVAGRVAYRSRERSE